MKMNKKTYEGKIIEISNMKSEGTHIEIVLDRYYNLENLNCEDVKITTQQEYELIDSIQEWIRSWMIDEKIYIEDGEKFVLSSLSPFPKLSKSDMKTIHENLNKNNYYREKGINYGEENK